MFKDTRNLASKVVEMIAAILKGKKIKKNEKKTCILFLNSVIYHLSVRKTDKIRSVGQAAKTSPSHGENRGSIPLQTVAILNSPTRINGVLMDLSIHHLFLYRKLLAI